MNLLLLYQLCRPAPTPPAYLLVAAFDSADQAAGAAGALSLARWTQVVDTRSGTIVPRPPRTPYSAPSYFAPAYFGALA